MRKTKQLLLTVLHRQHVHPVDQQPGHVVPARVEARRLGPAPLCRAHAVVVVLAHEDDGQLPERGDVEGLGNLALVGGAVAVEGVGDAAVALGGAEGESERKGEGEKKSEWEKGKIDR